jgi:phage protein D
MPGLFPQTTVDPASPYVILEMRRRKKDKPIQIDGDRVLEVKYKDTARHTADRLTFTLDNADGLVLADPLLMRKGTLIRLRFGYPGLDRDAGDFVLKKRKPSGMNMTFECHEAKRSQISRKPNTRQWSDVSRSDVVRQILQRVGFSGSLLDVDNSELTSLPIITQMREGDYQFIERLADEEMKEFWIDADGAHWKEPARNKKPRRKIKYPKGLIVVGAVIGDPRIEDFSANAPGRITLRGINPLTGEEFEVRASDSDVPDEIVKGLVKLNETEDLMTPEDGDEEASGNDGFEIVDYTGARSKEEAKLEADTLYKEYRYGALKMKVPIVMDPHLKPRRTIEVLGLGSAVDGKWYVKEVNHTISPGQFATSEVELNKDGLNKKRKARSDLRFNRNQRDTQRGAA